MTEAELVDRIADIFLDRLHQEYGKNETTLSDYDNPSVRASLKKTNPSLSKIFESKTRDESKKLLDDLAIANSVAYTILKTHRLFHHQTI